MPWIQASVSMQHKQWMTPQQRQTLLEYYCAHPDLVGLYSMLDNTLVDALAQPEAAALLPRGLHAVLQLVGGRIEQPSALELRHMLFATIRALSQCFSPDLAPDMGPSSSSSSSSSMQAITRVAGQWVQQGVLEDLKQAAGLASREAPLTLAQVAVAVGRDMPAAPCALVDCLLEHPQQLERLSAAAGKVADALDGPGPLTDHSEPIRMSAPLIRALQLAAPGPRLQQLLAGPLGQQLRRIGRHQGDARLRSNLLVAVMFGSAVAGAAVLSHTAAGNPTGPADLHALFEGALGNMKAESTAQAAHVQISQQMDQALAKEGRKQGRLCSKGCDQCGKTGVALAKEGGKLLRCTGCEQAWYCGAGCQKEAWKAGHKVECRAAQKAVAAGAARAGSSKGAGSSMAGAGR
jgi:hypothetical protein